MAWGKVLRISVGDPADPFKAEFDASQLPDLEPTTLGTANTDEEAQAVSLSGLTVGFRVTRSNIFNDNKAEINIANVSPETAERFISARDSYIVIEAGYQDEGTGQIFNGYITSAVGQWHGADHYLNIVAKTIRAKGYANKDNKGLSLEVVLGRESRKVRTNTYVSLSYGPGSKLIDIIKTLSVQMGIALTVFNESTVATFLRPNGYNYVGRVKGVVNDIRDFLIAEGYDMTVSLSEMVVFKLYDTGSTLDIPALSYDTGLLKVGPVQNYEVDPHQLEAFPPKKVWEVETILIHQLAPNGIVQIKSDQLDGFYLIESVEHHGDNVEGDFNSTLIVSQQ